MRIKFESKSAKIHSKNNNFVDNLETDLSLQSINEEEDMLPAYPCNHDRPDSCKRNEKHKAVYDNG